MADDWLRFWVPRTGQVDLSDAGFMVDPANTILGSPSASRPVSLVDLRTYHALALLGEPGMGKSTTLKAEADRLAETTPDNSTISMRVDLRAFSSDEFLYRRVFESPEILAWKRGTSHITLHLDSLDEALLRIDSIANLLAAELTRLPTSRMSLRIACRTAVWPALTLEPALKTIWGETAVGVFELTPLRRIDVITAAKDRGIDSNAFVDELFSANAVPFAIKPLTLNWLLSLFERDGRLPRSLMELYRLGCLMLCEEKNPSRHDTRRSGHLNLHQRLRLASRIAAVTMLANRYAIWIGPETDTFPGEDVALSTLAGGREEGTFDSFDVTADEILEILDTGLFTSRGVGRMGWAHQSYAEFLAATYLIERNVSAENILKIFRHPSGGLIPQTLVVASWAASLKTEVREGLITSDPMVGLRSDLANWDASDRERLTSFLLSAYEEGRIYDFFPGLGNAYSYLSHPNLASQLRPVIQDNTKSEVVRRAAFMIAEACKLQVLQPDLLNVALNPSENPSLRARAVSALATCGDASIPALIMPLAKGELGPDPLDEIKGYALRILWPDHVNAIDLFSMISRPDEGYFGAYTSFLHYELPESLSKDDLLPALQWATSFIPGTTDDGDFSRKSLADKILTIGWKHFDELQLTQAFVDNVLVRLHNFGELFRGTSLGDRDSFFADVKSDTTRRRAFLFAASKRGLGRPEAMWLARAPFIQQTDLDWLLSISPGQSESNLKTDEETLCNLIDALANPYDHDHFDKLYNAASNWKMLWQRYVMIFEGVPLASMEARQARETHNLMKQHERNIPPPLDPPPSDRVRARLDQYEAGDLNAWWLLNLDLTLAPTSRHYSDLEFLITEMPGWVAADNRTRTRIIDAAEHYLARAQSHIGKWLGTNSFQRSDLAAYRAFVLLLQQRAEAYVSLGDDLWRKWAPIIVAVPRGTGTTKTKPFGTILADASSHAPDEVARTVSRLIGIERTKREKPESEAEQPVAVHFYFLRMLDGCWGNDALKIGSDLANL